MNQIAMQDQLALLLGQWAIQLGTPAILFRVGLSFIIAGIIGCERANKRHSAGLRTFIVVSLASTGAMLLDIFSMQLLSFQFPLASAGTIIGIALTSSNSILYSSRSQVKGLTTAIALWACSIIGLALGAGFYTMGLIAFTALFCCLSMLPRLEIYLKNRSNHFEIHLELKDKRNLEDFIMTIRQLGMRIDDIESNPAYINSGLSVFSISLTITGDELKKYKKHKEIIEALRSVEYVCHIEEIQ